MSNLLLKIRFDPVLNDEMYDVKTFIQKVPVHDRVMVNQGYPGGPEFQAIEKFLVHASAFQWLQALLLLLLMNRGLSIERRNQNIKYFI